MVLPDVGHRPGAAALRDDIAGAGFAPATLGGYTEFGLDFLENQPGACMTGDFAVGDAAADADNHGESGGSVLGRF